MKTPRAELLLVLGLVACGEGSIGENGVDTTRAFLKGPSLLSEDSGKTFSIGPDELLTVTLNAQASTGYGWQVDGIDPKVLRLAGTEQITSPDLGGTDQQILRFAGVSPGRASVTLTYRRPWEKYTKVMADGTAAPMPSFTATVEVKEGGYSGSYKDPSTIPVTPRSEPLAAQGLGASLPSSFTYCDASTCSPVKDQGTANSCWAFATVGVTEQLMKKAGAFHSLSEQHLISCNTSNYSAAQGGYQGFPWYQNKADKKNLIGVVYDADYPYTGSDASCKSVTHHEKIAGWTEISSGNSSTAALKQAIYDHGAIWVGVCADDSWHNYTGGVFSGSNCGQANHAIVLTGWDDSTGTFLLRNSWGSSWGESGYMRIKYGVNALGDKATYVQYTASCTPSCSGKSCGSDGCGGTCGSCPSGQTCGSDGQCSTSTCTPSCSGKSCGSDGCGGTCGSCPSGQTCNTSGQCSAPTCTPSCSGKSCGSDGCGGTCGSCQSGESCDASGQCAPSACTPSCNGKECGSDGCGGTCGMCPTGLTCDTSGQCSGGSTCTHSVCTVGAPMPRNCDSCVTRICSVDPFCCMYEWDFLCKMQVSWVCNQSCGR